MLKNIATRGAALTAREVDALPTASGAYRSTVLAVPQENGEDVSYICLKGESGAYYWVTLAAGGY